MRGAAIFVVAMVVVVPLGVMAAGALWSAAFGRFASATAETGGDRTDQPG